MDKLITSILASTFLFSSTTKGAAQVIHGVVNGPDGRPLADVLVRSDEPDIRDSAPYHAKARTDKSGQFTIQAVSGILFFQKSGYTPFAKKLTYQLYQPIPSQHATVTLSTESMKGIADCSGPTPGATIRSAHFRYSVLPNMCEQEHEAFTCRTQSGDVLQISGTSNDFEHVDRRLKTTEQGYQLTEGQEYHHDLPPEAEDSETIKSASGKNWIDWTGGYDAVGGRYLSWRYFVASTQIAQYGTTSRESVRVFDAIIDSICKLKDSEKDSPTKK